jgi:putative endonuclease
MKTYFVYIMASASRTLYTGITSALGHRVLQYRHKTLGGFTAHYNVNRLVYYEQFIDVRDAFHARNKSRAGVG